MSMTDPAAPAAPTPPPAAPAAPPAAETPPPVHPSWDKALSALPEYLAAPVIEQIRATERESQKAIEDARAGSVDPTWRDFVAQSSERGVTPEALIAGYNVGLAIQQDPFGFMDNLKESIDKEVAAGRLTAPQGRAVLAEAGAAVKEQQQEVDPFADPRVAELETRLNTLTEAQTKQQEEQQAAAAQADADQYATQFLNELGNQTKGASDQQRQMVGYTADSMLAAAAPGTLTPQKAIELAVTAAKDAGIVWVDPDITPPPAAPPVGGGGNGMPTEPPTKLPTGDTPADRAVRAAAMLAAGQAVLGNG